MPPPSALGQPSPMQLREAQLQAALGGGLPSRWDALHGWQQALAQQEFLAAEQQRAQALAAQARDPYAASAQVPAQGFGEQALAATGSPAAATAAELLGDPTGTAMRGLEAADAFALGVGDQVLGATGSPAAATAGYLLGDPMNLAAGAGKAAAGVGALGGLGWMMGRQVDPRNLSALARAHPGQRGIAGSVDPLVPLGSGQLSDVTPLAERAGGIPGPAHSGFQYPPDPPGVAARGADRRPRLSETERETLAGLGLRPGEERRLRREILDYKRARSPHDGWRPFTVEATVKDGKVEYKYKGGGFNFHLGRDGKQLGPQERTERVHVLSQRMVEDVDSVVQRARAGDENARFILSMADWYKDARRNFIAAVGEREAGTYARLQGAFSPNTELSIQDRYADEVFNRFLGGEFDDTLDQLRAHMANGGTIKDFPDELVPRQGSGAKYGMNMRNALKVFMDEFDTIEPGMAPKMRNFAQNFIGDSVRPTIDVWAARTMQRLAHEAGYVDHPRVIPEFNRVEGQWRKPGSMTTGAWKGKHRPEITSAYGLGVDVYETAATRLDIDPSALQALQWFREKELWENARFSGRQSRPDLKQITAERYNVGPVLQTWESAPGSNAAHAPMGALDTYHSEVLGSALDPTGRDRFVGALGGPDQPREVVHGPGVFEGQVSPGVTSVSTGAAPGGRVTPSTRARVRAQELVRGLALGQDAVAASMLTQGKRVEAVSVHAPLTPEKARELSAALDRVYGPGMVATVNTPEGFALVNFGGAKKFSRKFKRGLDGDMRALFGDNVTTTNQSIAKNPDGYGLLYEELPWGGEGSPVTRMVLDAIDDPANPAMRQHADSPEARELMGDLAGMYERMRVEGGMPNEQIVTVLNAWKTGGLAAVRELVRNGLAPAIAIGVVSQMAPRADPGA